MFFVGGRGYFLHGMKRRHKAEPEYLNIRNNQQQSEKCVLVVKNLTFLSRPVHQIKLELNTRMTESFLVFPHFHKM